MVRSGLFKLFKSKSFWTLFISLSIGHVIEDMVWAVLARYTTVPLFYLLIGIILWSFVTALIVRYWERKKDKHADRR